MVVVPRPETGVYPTMLAIQGDSGGVGLGYLKENNSLRALRDGGQESGTDATAPPGGIDGQVEDFRLVGSALAPGAEPGSLGVDQSYQHRESGVIAQRPLGRFRTMVLNAGDCMEIAFGPWPDQDGISRAVQT